MAIRCPACQHMIELTGAKPGHYRPGCPACRSKFDLLIPNDPNESPRVAALNKPAVTAPPTSRADVTAAGATQPPPPPSKPGHVDRTQFFIAAPPSIAYDDLHGRLGGYEIVQKLGQGGMGSVYLARQLSLDRNVALKTLSPTLAGDPQFVSRFTREAYAVAQLTHHNVVQIHDIGQDKGTNFFSMELVDGTNLAGLVEKEGHLDPITAVSYALQAARGLKFAHDQGLIHRDVKPENLLLNDAGVVKVADLGLVKRAGVNDASGGPSSAEAATGASTTQLNVSMGTPAYMAPEQARDAAKVDARADIYSLGCTLYDLITGRPPFSGSSAVEVITKHQTQAIIPPEKIVANVPKRLSEIIRKMTAKDPAARYPSMAAVVKEFEDFLGIADETGARGTHDHVKRVEISVIEFNAAPFARTRRNGILAFYVASVIAFVIGLLTVTPWLAGGAVAFAVLATVAYQTIVGLRQRTIVFSKVRQLVFGAGVMDWLTWIVAAALLIALLFFFGQLWIWVGVAVLAIAAAMMFHFGVDSVVAVQREEPIRAVEAVIRDMRVKGVDEDAIRGFVAKFSGRNWEEFYEALFGYESKIQARRLYGKGERGRERKRHAVWRDWLIAWIDQKLDARKADREARLLAKLEARALEARGVNANEANRQARNSAANVVDRAHAMKQSATAQRMAATLAPVERAPTDKKSAPPPTPTTPQWTDDDSEIAESLEGYERTGYFRRRFGGPFDILLGRRVRFLLAAVLLFGAGRWVQMNGVAHAFEEIRGVGEDIHKAEAAINRKIETAAREGKAVSATPVAAAEHEATTTPLRIAGVPDSICDAVGSWNGLACGALLLLSVPLYGHLMSLTVLLGCAIALAGTRMNLPIIGQTPWWLALGVGGGIALLGMLFFRRTDD